jgi:8-oxo-dGTP diphosphatase
MNTRHTVIPRTLCLIFHQDEILLIKASDSKDWVGIYNSPGGHIEKGEDILESAKCEIKEETGLDLPGTKLKGIIHVTNFYGKNILMFVTVSHTPDKTVKASREGELAWVSLKDLSTKNVLADVKPIINKVKTTLEGQIFTGTSVFDGQGQLLSLKLE